jgi:hypothetical protein
MERMRAGKGKQGIILEWPNGCVRSAHYIKLRCVYSTGTGTQDLALGVPATLLYRASYY